MAYRLKKTKELRMMSTKELQERLEDILIAQRRLRGLIKAGGGINPGQWRNIKKEKARILTILGEREREKK